MIPFFLNWMLIVLLNCVFNSLFKCKCVFYLPSGPLWLISCYCSCSRAKTRVSTIFKWEFTFKWQTKKARLDHMLQILLCCLSFSGNHQRNLIHCLAMHILIPWKCTGGYSVSQKVLLLKSFPSKKHKKKAATLLAQPHGSMRISSHSVSRCLSHFIQTRWHWRTQHFQQIC